LTGLTGYEKQNLLSMSVKISRAAASESLMLSGNWNPQISQMPADIRISPAARSLALLLAPAFLSMGALGCIPLQFYHFLYI